MASEARICAVIGSLHIEHCQLCITYLAIAKDHAHVEQLAQEAGIDITGYSIELERVNVKNQLGKPFEPSIKDALVHS